MDLHVLEKAELPVFIRQFLCMVYSNSVREVEFCRTISHRRECQTRLLRKCFFLFTMAFDPIFRWLHDPNIPRVSAAPDLLQLGPCVYADDFAVAASSFRSLMTALSPAFEVVDTVAGLNLNHRVQHANDSCQDLLEWVPTNCEEFRERKIVKHAKYVGTVIGPEGHLHRWTARREKFIQRTGKTNGTSKNLVERLVDFKILGCISAPDEATLKEAHALQCTTAGPYNAIPTDLLRAGSVCGLGIDLCGIRIISLAARF